MLAQSGWLALWTAPRLQRTWLAGHAAPPEPLRPPGQRLPREQPRAVPPSLAWSCRPPLSEGGSESLSGEGGAALGDPAARAQRGRLPGARARARAEPAGGRAAGRTLPHT